MRSVTQDVTACRGQTCGRTESETYHRGEGLALQLEEKEGRRFNQETWTRQSSRGQTESPKPPGGGKTTGGRGQRDRVCLMRKTIEKLLAGIWTTLKDVFYKLNPFRLKNKVCEVSEHFLSGSCFPELSINLSLCDSVLFSFSAPGWSFTGPSLLLLIFFYFLMNSLVFYL